MLSVTEQLRHDAPRGAAENVAATLIDEIKHGGLAVGEPLPTERDLCKRFDTSRPTVRQALIVLQMKGYMSTSVGKRPRATKPSIEQILLSAGDHIRELLGDAESGAHLEQMRQFIETGAVGAAAKNASNLHVAQINTALTNNYAAIGTSEFPKTDIAFHRALVAVVGNPIILTLHDMFVSTMLRYRAPVDDQTNHDQIVYEEHRLIYEAIVRGDAETASETMDRHLARSYRSRLGKPKKVIAKEAEPTDR